MIWALLVLGVGVYLFAKWLTDDKLQFEDEHETGSIG